MQDVEQVPSYSTSLMVLSIGFGHSCNSVCVNRPRWLAKCKHTVNRSFDHKLPIAGSCREVQATRYLIVCSRNYQMVLLDYRFEAVAFGYNITGL